MTPTTTPRKRAPRLPAAERRVQILDAALAISAREGMSAVSMESVAREVGIAKTVVYEAFPDRAALVTELLRREHSQAMADLVSVIPQITDQLTPDEILLSALDHFLEAVLRHPDRWRLILVPPEGTPPAVRAEVRQGRERLLQAIVPLIDWGIGKRGGPNLDPELAGETIVAVAENAARLVLTHPDRYSVARMHAFARTLVSAVRTG